MVNIYAIGSLLPLSSSRRGRKLFFNTVPRERSIPKTEAESVEDIVAANKKAVKRPIPNEGMSAFDKIQTKTPVNRAVRTTPAVAKTTPGNMIGLISINLVSNPTEKRIMLKATVPMICAI